LRHAQVIETGEGARLVDQGVQRICIAVKEFRIQHGAAALFLEDHQVPISRGDGGEGVWIVKVVFQGVSAAGSGVHHHVPFGVRHVDQGLQMSVHPVIEVGVAVSHQQDAAAGFIGKPPSHNHFQPSGNELQGDVNRGGLRG